MITFNTLEEMKPYYNAESNTYTFNEHIEINFNLDVSASINAGDINARDINATNIAARDISFYAVCFAYSTFKCKSIKGRRENAKYFCLDSEVEITGDKNED